MSTKLINYFNFRQFGIKLFGNLALIHSVVWRYEVSYKSVPLGTSENPFQRCWEGFCYSGHYYNVTTTFSQHLSIFYSYPNAVPFAIFALEITFRVKAGSYPLDCSGWFANMLCNLLLRCLGICLHEFKQHLFFQCDIQRANLALWGVLRVTLTLWNMHIAIMEFVLCSE